MPVTVDYDVIVVGAGVSGLTAATYLHENGKNVKVLEASTRVGGRTLTRRDAKYGHVDLGGTWVGPTQDRSLRMIRKLRLKTFPTQHHGRVVFWRQGTPTYYTDHWPSSWNPLVWLEVNQIFQRMDAEMQAVPPNAPWNSTRAAELDRITVQQWVDKNCYFQYTKDLVRAVVTTNVSAEPWECSALWYFWHLNCAGGNKRIWEVDNGGQERKLLHGSMQISEQLAAKLPTDCVKLVSPVESCEQVFSSTDDSAGYVLIRIMNGETFTARRAIFAVPPPMQLKVHFSPPLPPLRAQLIQRMPVGSTIKTQHWYKRPFWLEKDFSGFVSCSDPELPINNIADDVKPDHYPGVSDLECRFALTGFIIGENAKRLAPFTPEQRNAKVAVAYSKIFDSDEALRPIHYEEQNWLAEPYIGGCYASYCPPGVMSNYYSAIREPHGLVHFAGTETGTHWPGYMDGAIDAGERSAREILHEFGLLKDGSIFVEEPPDQDCIPRPFHENLAETLLPSVRTLHRIGQLTFHGVAFLAIALMLKRLNRNGLFSRVLPLCFN